MEIIVKAWLNGKMVTAGKLRWSGLRIEFWYHQEFLQRGYALDPVNLPLNETIFEAAHHLQGALGVFGDALPDAWNSYVLMQLHKRLFSDREKLLADTSPQRLGAMQFFSDSTGRETPRFHELEWLERIAEWISGSDQSEPLPELELGSSAGGAKPKTLIRRHGEEWIAKFPARDEIIPSPWLEHGAMSLAAACGVSTAQTRVILLNNAEKTPVLLVKRFDRCGSDRLQMLSAHTLCGVLKNEQGSVVNDYRSYLRLADRLAMIAEADPLDRCELFRRAAFNILIANHDDHVRNHVVVRSLDGKWRLSPAFDLVPGSGNRRDLAMIIGQYGNEASVRNLLSECERFALSREDATAIVQQLLEVLSGWRKIFAHAGVPERWIDDIAWALRADMDV